MEEDLVERLALSQVDARNASDRARHTHNRRSEEGLGIWHSCVRREHSCPDMSSDAPVEKSVAQDTASKQTRKRRPRYAVFTEKTDGQVRKYYFVSTGRLREIKVLEKDMQEMEAKNWIQPFPYSVDTTPIKETIVEVLVTDCDINTYNPSHHRIVGHFDYLAAKARILVMRATEEFNDRLRKGKLEDICDPTYNEYPVESYAVYYPFDFGPVLFPWEGNENQTRLFEHALTKGSPRYAQFDLSKRVSAQNLYIDSTAIVITGRLMYTEFVKRMSEEHGLRYVFDALYNGGFANMFS